MEKLYSAGAIDSAKRDMLAKAVMVDSEAGGAETEMKQVEEEARKTIATVIAEAKIALDAWDASYQSIGAVDPRDPRKTTWDVSWDRLVRALPNKGADQGVDDGLLGAEAAKAFAELDTFRRLARVRVLKTNPGSPIRETSVPIEFTVDEIDGKSVASVNDEVVEAVNGRFTRTITLPGSDGPFDVAIRLTGSVYPSQRPPPLRYIVDRTKPTIQVDNVKNGQIETGQWSYTVTGHVEDANGVARVEWREKDGVWVGPISLNPRGDFRHELSVPTKGTTIEFAATDGAGNRGELPVFVWYGTPWKEPLGRAISAVKSLDFDEAEKELAAARKFTIAGEDLGKCKEVEAAIDRWRLPPTLVIDSPSEGYSTKSDEVTISGRLITARKSDRLKVNGEDVDRREDGSFSYPFKHQVVAGAKEITVEVYDERQVPRDKQTRHITIVKSSLVKSRAVSSGVKLEVSSSVSGLGVPELVENEWGVRFRVLKSDPVSNASPRRMVTYLQVTEISKAQFAEMGGGSRASDGHDEEPKVLIDRSGIEEFIGRVRQVRANVDPPVAYRLPTREEWWGAADLTSDLAAKPDWLKEAAAMNFADKSAEGGAGMSPSPSAPPPAGPAAPAAGTRGDGLPAPVVAQVPTFFPESDGYPGIAPVATFRPNRFGFYNLLGNVWEWASLRQSGSGSQASPVAEKYTLLGGSFRSKQDVVTSFSKRPDDVPADDVGFRLAFDIEVDLVKNLPEAKK